MKGNKKFEKELLGLCKKYLPLIEDNYEEFILVDTWDNTHYLEFKLNVEKKVLKPKLD